MTETRFVLGVHVLAGSSLIFNAEGMCHIIYSIRSLRVVTMKTRVEMCVRVRDENDTSQ